MDHRSLPARQRALCGFGAGSKMRVSSRLQSALRKLENALQFAGEGTGKIHTILREAEEEAARLFRGERCLGTPICVPSVRPASGT